jgi:D-amino-acid oxidase
VSARILVLGGGVSGLTCGVRLLEAGHTVELWQRESYEHTVSSVAGAIWSPYCTGPEALVLPWALASYREFQQLARDPATGVRLRA